MDILIFRLDSTRLALPSKDVQELHRAVTVMPLPKAPDIVEGIINVRGRVVPVLDIRARFGLAPRALSHADHLILARAGERLVALRVDCALDIVRVAPEDIEPPEAAGDDVAYVAGIAKLEDGLVLIHDLATFLDGAERAALDRAIATTEPGASP